VCPCSRAVRVKGTAGQLPILELSSRRLTELLHPRLRVVFQEANVKTARPDGELRFRSHATTLLCSSGESKS
jgi:hypothetical protein